MRNRNGRRRASLRLEDAAPRRIMIHDDADDFLRGRDPSVLGPMLQALAPRRAVFSWLTAGVPLMGLHQLQNPLGKPAQQSDR
jgi:hypothetical protein